MVVKIEILGNDKAASSLKRRARIIENKKVDALSKSALTVVGEVKASISGHRDEHASHDTGTFLRSVSSEVGQDEATVLSNVQYSKFLEFGTVKLAARRHFNNSLNRMRPRILKYFEQATK